MGSQKFLSFKFPLYPILIGIFPILQLFIVNFSQVPFYAILKALIISLAAIVLVWGSCLIIYRNRIKAALAASYLLILFFSYGHVYQLLAKLTVFGMSLGKYQVMTPLWIILAVAGGIYLFRRTYLGNLHVLFYSASIFLIAFSLIQLGIISLQARQMEVVTNKRQEETVLQNNNALSDDNYRDVYYIILDGYSRSDILNLLGYDNSSFLQHLEELGFKVQKCAVSNYTNTHKSLASSLNMTYLSNLGIDEMDDVQERVLPATSELLQHSLVRKIFQKMGYQFITFASKDPWLNITDSDIYIDFSKHMPETYILNSENGLSAKQEIPILERVETNDFYEFFYDTTMMRLIPTLDKSGYLPLHNLPNALLKWINPRANVFSTLRYWEYQQNLYALKILGELPSIPGRKFVYAHLMVTHSSFVFNRDGSFKPEEMETDHAGIAYLDQVDYLDGRLIKIVSDIITYSKVKPVIVLQGDHGRPDTGIHMPKILNALYLPDYGYEELTPTLTPVNTFRLILDTYFGEHNGQIENKTYREISPTKAELIPAICPN